MKTTLSVIALVCCVSSVSAQSLGEIAAKAAAKKTADAGRTQPIAKRYTDADLKAEPPPPPLSPEELEAATRRVTYRVSGSAHAASMTYASWDGGTEQSSDRTLPWEYTFLPGKGDFLYLSAQNQGQHGCVLVEIIRGPVAIKSSQSCGAYVIASTSGK